MGFAVELGAQQIFSNVATSASCLSGMTDVSEVVIGHSMSIPAASSL